MIEMLTKVQADSVIKALSSVYSNPKPKLEYKSPFELLMAVILSAQCTDDRVNEVTAELFKKYNTAEKMAAADIRDIKKIIFPCGFYVNKSKYLINSSKKIIDEFSGQVPENLEDLQRLDGVGKKTANVVYSVAFNGDAIAVDTHVFRVSNRIGLASSKTPEGVEKQLMEIIDKDKWSLSHHLLIYHGRNTCRARKPSCCSCQVNNICLYNNKTI